MFYILFFTIFFKYLILDNFDDKIISEVVYEYH